jgi:hypothetical protein
MAARDKTRKVLIKSSARMCRPRMVALAVLWRAAYVTAARPAALGGRSRLRVSFGERVPTALENALMIHFSASARRSHD